ncbi:MAG: tyrosine-type recombinase/integrase [Bdellovibrionales bacterium]|nr:tyrosine-type recombinase/integrase [Bdellovibrionales bacterium]
MNQNPKNYALTEDKILSESELKLMLKTIRPSMEQSLRTGRHLHFINDYFLIMIGSLTGLRVSEAAGIKIGDISENSLKVIGKGRKLRVIPLGKRGKSAFDELIRIKVDVMNQPVSADSYLFLNRNGKPFTRHAVARRFTYWRHRCHIKRSINYHSLRHHFCTYLLNNGFHLHEAQKILGHSSPTITAMYLHFTEQTQVRVEAVL